MPLSEQKAEDYLQQVTGLQRALYAYILSMVPDLARADDILQETNLVLWRKREQFAPGTQFRSWACHIAHLQVLAELKRAKSDRLRFEPEWVEKLAEEGSHQVDLLEARRRALADCMSRLSERERKLIERRYGTGLSLQQGSEKQGSANAVYQMLFRARRALMECVRQKLAAEGVRA